MARLFPLILGLLCGLVGCDSGGYRKSGGQWTYKDIAFTPEDAASFKPIDPLFGRDKLRGYYRGLALDESDGASFEALSEHEARDRNAVYYCDTYRKGQEYWSIQHLRTGRIAGADPASYTPIGRGYARDRLRVYAEGVPFTVRDAATFEPMDSDFGRDAQRGYYARTEIAGSHGPSFATIDERDARYVRDRTQVYYGRLEIDNLKANQAPYPVLLTLKDADPAAFRVLGRDYGADARHVWYRGLKVTGADPASFAVDEAYAAGIDAKDQGGAWERGKRVVGGAAK